MLPFQMARLPSAWHPGGLCKWLCVWRCLSWYCRPVFQDAREGRTQASNRPLAEGRAGCIQSETTTGKAASPNPTQLCASCTFSFLWATCPGILLLDCAGTGALVGLGVLCFGKLSRRFPEWPSHFTFPPPPASRGPRCGRGRHDGCHHR